MTVIIKNLIVKSKGSEKMAMWKGRTKIKNIWITVQTKRSKDSGAIPLRVNNKMIKKMKI